ncbi:hypothetical protein EYF80_028258 [Liparis tanakae]|uniref:Uncharacterized protein n=1 Tax=Liparis tanakae TaxID=230148 RepID=A0A4Z2H8Z5_9TELE|nr:hypothetical protein EYF80_028258 [Liparis tanakae]
MEKRGAWRPGRGGRWPLQVHYSTARGQERAGLSCAMESSGGNRRSARFIGGSTAHAQRGASTS